MSGLSSSLVAEGTGAINAGPIRPLPGREGTCRHTVVRPGVPSFIKHDSPRDADSGFTGLR